MKKSFLIILVVAFNVVIPLISSLKCYSIDPPGAAFSLKAESKSVEGLTEIQKVESVLVDLENSWNQHNIDKVLKHYADGFINGDGLDLQSVKKLTQELWEAYPNIQSKSQERAIRVNDEYATVESTDMYEGTSSNIREEVGTNGVLKAISTGSAFLKKFGPTWKITTDKTLFERVSIGYGVGTELIDKNKITFSAPEQVASGQPYTARVGFNLPKDIKAVAAITRETLSYPQVAGEDKFRLVGEDKLEKLLYANKITKNELLTTTIGLTGGTLKPKLLGLVFLSKRVNVVPVSEQISEESIIKEPAKSALSRTIDLLDNYSSNEQKTKQDKEQPGEKPEDTSKPDLKE